MFPQVRSCPVSLAGNISCPHIWWVCRRGPSLKHGQVSRESNSTWVLSLRRKCRPNWGESGVGVEDREWHQSLQCPGREKGQVKRQAKW